MKLSLKKMGSQLGSGGGVIGVTCISTTRHATTSVAPDYNYVSSIAIATELFSEEGGRGEKEVASLQKACNYKYRSRPQLHVIQHGCNWSLFYQWAAGDGIAACVR